MGRWRAELLLEGTLSLATDDAAIWQTAAFVLRRYGDDAAGFAARRAERLQGLGDKEGCSDWGRILRAIDDLRRATPIKGSPVNRSLA
jgi:hypothetical protein